MLWVPQEHGAWAWLVVPVAAGALIRPAGWFLLVLLGCAVSAYCCFNALSWWARMPPSRRSAAVRPAAVYGTIATLAAALLVVLTGPTIVIWFAVLSAGPAVSWALARRGANRSLPCGLATAFACSLLLLVAVEPDPLALSTLRPLAAWASALLFGYLGGTVFSVKSLIRQRGSVGWYAASVGWHAAWTITACLAASAGQTVAWVGLWILLTARAAVLPLLARTRPLHPATIGAIEIAASAALLVVVAMAVASAA